MALLDEDEKEDQNQSDEITQELEIILEAQEQADEASEADEVNEEAFEIDDTDELGYLLAQ